MSMTKIKLISKTVFRHSQVLDNFTPTETYFELEMTAYSGNYGCNFGYWESMPTLEELLEIAKTKESLIEYFADYLDENDCEFWEDIINDDPEIDFCGYLIEY